jgi:hypothetical protein
MQTGTFGGDYSRFTYDETDRYLMVLKEQGVAGLDDELNHAGEAQLVALRRVIQDAVGDGSPNDGFKIVGTGAANGFTILGGDGSADGAGRIYVAGYPVVLPSGCTYLTQEIPGPALTTPGGSRTDQVYLDVYLDEVGPAADARIQDPVIGAETSRRLKVFWLVRVAEGAAMPADYTDAQGRRHHTCLLATLARTATAAIDPGMVTDERRRLRHLAEHVAADSDPHPQYLNTTRGDATLMVIGHTHPVATATTAGWAEIATQAEVDAGTDDARIVTPKTLGVTMADAAWAVGDVKLTLNASAATGWLVMDDGTIGDHQSGATSRARADVHDLFTLLWSNVQDTWCPVAGGRGASAEADWLAHKTLALPRVLGRALAAAGAGQGLTSRALGAYAGAEMHTLTEAELPVHAHDYIKMRGGFTGAEHGDAIFTEQTQTGQITALGTIEDAGGGGAHSNLQPSAFLHVAICYGLTALSLPVAAGDVRYMVKQSAQTYRFRAGADAVKTPPVVNIACATNESLGSSTCTGGSYTGWASLDSATVKALEVKGDGFYCTSAALNAATACSTATGYHPDWSTIIQPGSTFKPSGNPYGSQVWGDWQICSFDNRPVEDSADLYSHFLGKEDGTNLSVYMARKRVGRSGTLLSAVHSVKLTGVTAAITGPGSHTPITPCNTGQGYGLYLPGISAYGLGILLHPWDAAATNHYRKALLYTQWSDTGYVRGLFVKVAGHTMGESTIRHQTMSPDRRWIAFVALANSQVRLYLADATQAAPDANLPGLDTVTAAEVAPSASSPGNILSIVLTDTKLVVLRRETDSGASPDAHKYWVDIYEIGASALRLDYWLIGQESTDAPDLYNTIVPIYDFANA